MNVYNLGYFIEFSIVIKSANMIMNNNYVHSVIRFWHRDASLAMDAEAYGFVYVPEIVISKPEGLPDPCTCGTCACKNGCCCRVAGIKYCKCKGGDSNGA